MTRKFLAFILAGTLISGFFITSCDDDTGSDINIFTIEDDRQLGRDLHEQIKEDEQFDLMDREEYEEAYQHLDRIGETLLNSGELKRKEEFDWNFYLIDNDTTLNAFAAPGGYLYFYTGLIDFLDTEHQFAGVFGHEIAHADLRHSTQRMTRAYGVQTLLDIVLGEDRSQLADVAADLALLSYNRDQESEADEYSVIYLNPTEYDARGAAGFFEKMNQHGGASPPEFLSTHPDPENRVDEIHNKWEELGSQEGEEFEERYQEFKDALP